MKNEELLRYERMYMEVRRKLGTPFLAFAYPKPAEEVADGGASADRSRPEEERSLRPANGEAGGM